jgi:hypothetical protein
MMPEFEAEIDENPTWSSELQKERPVYVPSLSGAIPVIFLLRNHFLYKRDQRLEPVIRYPIVPCF